MRSPVGMAWVVSGHIDTSASTLTRARKYACRYTRRVSHRGFIHVRCEATTSFICQPVGLTMHCRFVGRSRGIAGDPRMHSHETQTQGFLRVEISGLLEQRWHLASYHRAGLINTPIHVFGCTLLIYVYAHIREYTRDVYARGITTD